MIETIKHIGLFMIVAQTLMHFAAGQQYEKYMKIIAGVIVLMLFISPFYSTGDNFADQWQEKAAQIAEDIEHFGSLQYDGVSVTDYGTKKGVTRQLEEEMKKRLNEELLYEEYDITDVSVEWEEKGAQDMAVRSIRITLRQTGNGGDALADEEGDGDTIDSIVIDRIQVGTFSQPDEQAVKSGEHNMGTEPETGAGQQGNDFGTGQGAEERQLQEYCSLFAGILGVEEEKVEVVCSGGR